jgi:hypothetical protein
LALALAGQEADAFGRIGGRKVEAVPAISERGHPTERRVAVAPGHDRDRPATHRPGVHADALETDEITME